MSGAIGQRRGYTLVELLAVLAILSILAMGVAPLAQIASQRQKEQILRRNLWAIRDALDAFKQAADQGQVSEGAAASGYPVSLAVLVEGAKDRQGQSLHFLRQIPRDPFADDNWPAEKGWAVRSYASSAQSPQPGADVYDVHSRSERLGSDGTPLAQW